MATQVSYVKGGVKLQCDVSSYPAPRPQGAWPIPAFADAESSLISLSLVSATGSAISNILVQSVGPLPGSSAASWSVSDQAYQGTAPNPLPVAQSIPVILSANQNLTLTVINPMAGATHNVWLTRIDAGKVTTFPSSAITTPADPTQAAISTAQTTATTANTNANTANTNASAAQTTANTANTNASAAQTTANNAASAASAAQTTANNAASAASTAETQLAAITNQNVLTAGEKPAVIIDYNALTGGQSGIDAQAAAYGVSHTAFDTAVSTLTSYLTGLSPAWNDCTQNTLIVGSTFQSNWVTAYTTQQALLNAIYAAAQVLANNAQTTANNIVSGLTALGGGNLLMNSSFESGSGGLASNWELYDNGPEGATTSFSTTAPILFGAQCQRVSWTVNNTSTKGLCATTTGHGFSWQPGGTYALSYYARATGTNVGQTMELNWNVNPGSETVLFNPPLTTSWQRYAFRLVWGASVDNAFYTSIGGGSGTQGTLDFDGFQVELGSIPTGYSLNPSDAMATANAANSTANTAAANASTALNLVPAVVNPLPTLPNTNYPAGRIVMLSTNSQLYQVNTAGTSWVSVQVNAAQVSGTLPAAQIGAGLTASQISSVNAAAVGAGLTASQISSVNAAAVGNGITGSQIASGTITGGNIVGSTITGGNIAGGTITGGNIAGSTITGSNIVGQTITAAQIASGTITASQIAANTITAGQIAANTITSSQIAAGSIGAAQIAAGSITATQIASGTITANQLNTSLELVSGVIQSSNFDGSSAGWCIYGDGSANFTTGLNAGGMNIVTIVSQLEYAYAYAEKGGGCCVRADSIVMGLTEDKPISQIKLRDNIISYDFKKKDNQVCNVVGLIRTIRDSHYQVTTTDGTELHITGDHPMYNTLNGWSIINSLDEYNSYREVYNLTLSNLTTSDNVFCFGGVEEGVCSIRLVQDPQVMYTLRVNHSDHNYYANGVMVHNGSGGDCLSGDTLICTPSGDKKLVDIDINDVIYTFQNGQLMAKPVTICVEVFHRDHYQIRFRDGRMLRISSDHPMLTTDGWKSINPDREGSYRVFQLELKQLQVGDMVLRLDGTSVVKSITKIRGDVELYTIGTRDGNNFIANGLVIHDNYSPV